MRELTDEEQQRARRQAVIDEIHERGGMGPSIARQFEIRADALARGRAKLGLTGALRASNLERERCWREAALQRYAGNEAHVVDIVERIERAGTGLASVTPLSTEGMLPAPSTATGRTIYGFGARFNEPAEVLSAAEGNFIEVVRPTAFDRTLSDGHTVRSFLNHGRDPQLGQRPLGRLTLSTDAAGLRYSVEVLDNPTLDYVLDACKAGLFGSSFSFHTKKERWRQPAGPTPTNPMALAERELLDIQLHEVGPVTWPTYSNTAVAVRSVDATTGAVVEPLTRQRRAAMLRRIEMNEAGLR